ncbi:MAG: Gfo/Idh/MocA family oxidoreductase [Phycisphaeraceae bacterium]|nr:Gfo/Idh/MocA family oxidoreductase [Phycisphaeraceae bacterium]
MNDMDAGVAGGARSDADGGGHHRSPRTPTGGRSGLTRREFVTRAAAITAAGAIGFPAVARRPPGDPLRIGLIGCGGRGTGAAAQALTADSNTVLWAMADAFEDRLVTAHDHLSTFPDRDRIQVAANRRFVGLESYREVIDSGVDVVLLTSPSAFRPEHLEASIAAGKHVFCEKPMGVDAPAVRRCRRACEEAEKRGLAVVSGFCWRYSLPERETYARVHDGAIGAIRSMHATYHTGLLGVQRRRPEWSDWEFQLRNWHHFTWLSGDHIVEQACHSVDKINWAMRNVPPLRCTALGGRGLREGEERGNVYDHFAVIYEYPDGVRCFLTCRQQAGCSNDNTDFIMGERGTCFVNGWGPTHVITGENAWTRPADAPRPNMYQVEHDELFASIRSGRPINDGPWMMQSTMLSIMGRMAAYTGQTITWAQAIDSQEDLRPTGLAPGQAPPPIVAKPGVTRFL